MPDAPDRSAQKARTRADLLAAARRLMAEGAEVTVAAAARAARVSRATAYRYFSDPEALVLEAALDPEVRPTADILAGLDDPRDRALAVQAHFLQLARAEESRFRPYLARTMDAWVKRGPRARLRGARRVAAFRAALAPARGRMDARDFDDLVHGLSALTGIEAHVALADVCRLSPRDADRAARRAAEALLDRRLP